MEVVVHRFFYSSFLIGCQLAVNETIGPPTDEFEIGYDQVKGWIDLQGCKS